MDLSDEHSLITNFVKSHTDLPLIFYRLLGEGSVQNDIGYRHGSRINNDRFPKRSAKVHASRRGGGGGGGGGSGGLHPGKLFGF